MYVLLLKLNHIYAFTPPPMAMESPVLYIDAHIYKSTSYAAFYCSSSVNDAFAYLIDHLFVYVWSFTQTQSYSTGPSPVARHGKYPINFEWRKKGSILQKILYLSRVLLPIADPIDHTIFYYSDCRRLLHSVYSRERDRQSNHVQIK